MLPRYSTFGWVGVGVAVHRTRRGGGQSELFLLSRLSLSRHLLAPSHQGVEINVLGGVHVVLRCLPVLVLDQLVRAALEEVAVEDPAVMQGCCIVQWRPAFLVLGLTPTKY